MGNFIKFIIWLLGMVLWILFMTVVIGLLIIKFPRWEDALTVINVGCSIIFGTFFTDMIFWFDYEKWKRKREYRKKWGY